MSSGGREPAGVERSFAENRSASHALDTFERQLARTYEQAVRARAVVEKMEDLADSTHAKLAELSTRCSRSSTHE
jgi:hypothetical protein